jgi:ParB-like chromosome segregation protein Spo0J|tara:strand:- start:776 stop:1198 length:423 start_codon:yes stop_codon:yes gene_type:complete
LKIVDKHTWELIPADYNPREISKSEYNKLKADIKQKGILQPIIINTHKGRENIIIGGHQRYSIAVELGIQTLPCIEVDFDYEKEIETNIKLNKLGGKFDKDKLANWFDVETLKEWGFKPIDFGFNLDKLPEKCECCGKQK